METSSRARPGPWSGASRGPTAAKLEAEGTLRASLSAWSITVLDLTLRRPTAP